MIRAVIGVAFVALMLGLFGGAVVTNYQGRSAPKTPVAQEVSLPVSSSIQTDAGSSFVTPTDETQVSGIFNAEPISEQQPSVSSLVNQSTTPVQQVVSDPSLAPRILALERELALIQSAGFTVQGIFPTTPASQASLGTQISTLSPELERRLQELSSRITSSVAGVQTFAANNAASNYAAISLTNKIDQLNGAVITNARVTGTFSGLSDDMIPDDITINNPGGVASFGQITAGNATTTNGTSTTFAVSSALTVAGTVRFSGLNCTGNLANGALTADATGLISCSDDDSGGSTSGVALSGSVISLISSTSQVAFGTTSASGLSQLTIGASTTNSTGLTIVGQTGQTANLFQVLSSVGQSLFSVGPNGELLVAGSSTLQDFTFQNATGSSATTSNFSSDKITGTEARIGSIWVTNLDISNASTSNFAVSSLTGNTASFSGAVSVSGAATLASLLLNGSTTLQNFSFNNATGTTLFAGTVSGTAGNFTNLFGTALTFVDATGTSATTTNLFSTNFNAINASTSALNSSSLSVSGVASLASLLLNGSSTLQAFTAQNATITSATATALFVSNLTATNFDLGGLNTTNSTTTNATTTNFAILNALSVSGPATLSNLLLTGSTTLQNASAGDFTARNLVALTSFRLAPTVSCAGGQALQTDGSGFVSCGSVVIGNITEAAGWLSDIPNQVVTLSTTTFRVGIGATTTPYGKLSVISGSTATTTAVFVPSIGATADIVHLYDSTGALSTVVDPLGNWRIGGTLGVSSTALFGQGITAYASSTFQNFTGQNATVTSATATNFFVSNLSATNFTPNAVDAQSGTTTNATSTNFATANLSVSGNATLATLVVSGSSTLQNFTGQNATITSATATNLAISNALTVSGPVRFALLNCTGNANGGALTADATGNISCSDDDSGAAGVSGFTDDGVVVRLTSASDQLAVGTTTPSGLSQLTIGATTTASIALTLKGQTGQTADLFRILSSLDQTLFSVASDGSILTLGSTTLQNFTGQNATVTSATATSLFVTNLVATNFNPTVAEIVNGTTTNATSTTLSVSSTLVVSGTTTLAELITTGSTTLQTFTATNSTTTSGTSTNFFSTNLTSNNSAITTLSTTNLTANGSTTLQNFTGVNATTSNATSTNFATTNLTVSGPATLANLLLAGSTTLQSFTATNSTTTAGTSTNFFSTNFSSTNSTITNLSTTNLTATGSTTLQDFTGVNATTSNATSTNFATTNLTVSGPATLANVLLTGSSTFQDITFVNATGTSATTTNFAVIGLATSTFAGGINLGSGCFAINGVCLDSSASSGFIDAGTVIRQITNADQVSFGTTSPSNSSTQFTVWGSGSTDASKAIEIVNFSSTTLLSVSNGGAVSLGGSNSTTTVNGFLDVLGTGTNATSTFASNLWVKGALRIGTGSLYLNDSTIFAQNGAFSFNTNGTSTYATSSGFAFGGNALFIQQGSGSVGIGTTSPHSSAILALDSTTKGFGLPSMTSAQRNAIANPLPGLTIFNTTTRFPEYFDGTTWQSSVATSGPAFKANLTVNQNVSQNVSTKVDFNTESFDTNGNFDLTTDQFTPTVAGRYIFTCSLTVTGTVLDGSLQDVIILLNGASVSQSGDVIGSALATAVSTTVVLDMNGIDDDVQCNIQSGNTAPAVTAVSQFSGGMVGGGGSGGSSAAGWTDLGNTVGLTTNADQVSIGTTTPSNASTKLTIWGNGITSATKALEIVSNASTSLFSVLDSGSIGIGTATPHASAALIIDSTTKGLGLPRLSNAQRNAISNPIQGLMIFNTSNRITETFDGTTWQPVTATSGPAFRVTKGGTDQTGITPDVVTALTWSTEEFDTNNNFAGNAFTPTIPGRYLITANIYCFGNGDTSEQCVLGIRKNGSQIAVSQSGLHNSGTDNAVSVSTIVDMNGTTDSVDVTVTTKDTSVSGITSVTSFSGAMVGGPGQGGGSGASNSGFDDDGTVVHTTTNTDQVAVGTTTPSNVTTKFTIWGSGVTNSTNALEVINNASTSLFTVSDSGVSRFGGSLQASSTALFTQGFTAYASSTLQILSVGGVARFLDQFSASSTALFTQGFTAYASSTLQDVSVTDARINGVLQASSTALFGQGFTAYASSTLQDFTARNATATGFITTRATSTNATSTNVAVLNAFTVSGPATLANLLLTGSTTLQDVTTNNLRVLGQFGASSTALFTQGFTVYASSTVQDITAQNATTVGFVTTRATSTNATSTNVAVLNAFTVSGPATLANLLLSGSTTLQDVTSNSFRSLGLFQSSSTALFGQGLTAYASSTFQTFSGTNGTTTNFAVLNALTVGGPTTLTNLLLSGSTTLQNFTANLATATGIIATRATTTNATSTNISISNALTVSGQASLANALLSGSSTLQDVTTNNLRVLGQFGASSTALFTQGFTAYASTTLQNFVARNATTSNATSTGLVAVTGAGTSTFSGNLQVDGGLKVGTGSIFLSGSATSTFTSGGINLTSGCFAIAGNCITVGGAALLGIYSTSTPGTNANIVFDGAINSAPTFTAGSPGTLHLPSNTAYFTVELWGSGAGGGGGGGDSGNAGNSGGSGNQSCFGVNATACTSATIAVAGGNGGGGGAADAFPNGGAGGSGGGSIVAGDVSLAGQGGSTGGTAGDRGAGNTANPVGGSGGSAPRGGGGGAPGVVGAPFGGGGGGGSGNGVSNGGGGGGGGGAGGYVQKLVTSIQGYKYTIGVGGAGATTNGAGTSAGFAGGAGGMVISVFTSGGGTSGAGGGFAKDGSVVRLTDATDFVGIGSTTPFGKLSITGNSNQASSTPLFAISTTAPSSVSSSSNYFSVSGRGATTINGRAIDPEMVGRLATSLFDGAHGIFVQGNYAYLANRDRGSLAVVNISSSTQPVFVSEVLGLGAPYSVFVSGNYAYVAENSDDSFSVIDVSNPANPRFLAETRGPVSGTSLDQPTGIFVSGNYAYVSNETRDSLAVIDVSSSTRPRFLAETRGPNPGTSLNGAYSVFVSGNYAYVPSFLDDSLSVIDISIPDRPLFLAQTKGPVAGTSLNGARGVFVQGGYAYVVNSFGNSMAVVDVTNPSNPVFVAAVPGLFVQPSGIFVSGDYAYVSDEGRHSLAVIDISQPNAPRFVTETRGPQPAVSLLGAAGVFVSGNYAYIVNANVGNDSLAVIDISGLTVSNAQIGTAKIGNLAVDNFAQFSNGVNVTGGLNVGHDALISGALTINGLASTTALSSASSTAFKVVGGSSAFGTTTAYSRLTVWGTGVTESTKTFEVVNNASTSLFSILDSGSIGVGTATPHSSAAFIIDSTTKGFGLPRMTSTQRDAISNPIQGLMIFNTSAGQVQVFDGATWSSVGGGGSSGPSFRATKGGTNQSVATGQVLLTWSTEEFDTNNNFNTSTGRFTPTVAGKYIVVLNGGFTSTVQNKGYYFEIQKNGTRVAKSGFGSGEGGGTPMGITTSAIVDMNGTTDFIEAYSAVDSSSDTVNGDTSITNFTAILVGGSSGSGGAGNTIVARLASDYVDTGADVPELSFAIGANETWIYDFSLVINGSNGIRINAPTGSTCTFNILHVEDADDTRGTSCGTEVVSGGAQTATNESFNVVGTVKTDSIAGTVSIRISNPLGGTVKAGSIMRATKTGSSGSSGFVDDGAVVRLANNADQVSIGTTTPLNPGTSLTVWGQGAANTTKVLELVNSASTTLFSVANGGTISALQGAGTGFFGIGTSSPSARLSVSGQAGGSIPLFLISTSSPLFATTTVFTVSEKGFTGIGATTSPKSTLSVKGFAGQQEGVMTISTTTASGIEKVSFFVGNDGRVGIGTTSMFAGPHVLTLSGPIVVGALLGAGESSQAAFPSGRATSTFGTDIFTPNVVRIGSLISNMSLIGNNTGICVTGNGYVGDCPGTPADIAEWYPTEDGINAGEIVGIGGTTLAYTAQGSATNTRDIFEIGPSTLPVMVRATTSQNIFGVVSTGPVEVFGEDIFDVTSTSTRRAIALAGRVPVKVNMEGGAIARGDRITISTVAGVGARATTTGNTIGIALESASAPGSIMVFVDPQFHIPLSQFVIDGNGNLAIGTTTDPLYKLKVGGDVAATGFVNISTEASKTDIEHLTEDQEGDILNKIESVRVATYHYKSEDPTNALRLGLIAEEAPKEVLSNDGKGVDIYKLATFALAGIKAQQSEIEKIKARLDALEAETPLPSVSSGELTLKKLFVDEITSKKLCVDDVCVTKDEFKQLLEKNGLVSVPSTGSAVSTPAVVVESGASSTPTTDTEPPVISITGNNPATVSVGSSYVDLGALVTDNVTQNIGVITTGDQIDTSTEGTHEVRYNATDAAGNNAVEAIRIVNVVRDEGTVVSGDVSTTTTAE